MFPRQSSGSGEASSEMESVHTDTKKATYDRSRRGKPRVLAIGLIGERQSVDHQGLRRLK